MPQKTYTIEIYKSGKQILHTDEIANYDDALVKAINIRRYFTNTRGYITRIIRHTREEIKTL